MARLDELKAEETALRREILEVKFTAGLPRRPLKRKRPKSSSKQRIQKASRRRNRR